MVRISINVETDSNVNDRKLYFKEEIHKINFNRLAVIDQSYSGQKKKCNSPESTKFL